jgi:hypothetical protein
MKTTLRPPAVLALVALISAGCGSNAGSGADKKPSARDKAVKFAECMRDNGVDEFPDPDASGELTIDGVVNGSSLDTSAPSWKTALATCKDLRPPGFTGPRRRSAEQQSAALRFAQCIRDNGVKDFPDPVNGEPLVNTYKIPSSNTPNGMAVLNAAMHKCGSGFKGPAGGQP